MCNFFTAKEFSPSALKHSLNSLLPPDIAALNLEIAPDHFHPTLDSKGKEYLYQICTHRSSLPFNKNYSWYFPYPLCLDTLKKGAEYFVGKHDFSSFCNQSEDLSPHRIREIEAIEVIPQKEGIAISIRGKSFLYKMVRNIVGTLVQTASGKIPLSSLPDILHKRDRKLAGMTAPAQGLILRKIFY